MTDTARAEWRSPQTYTGTAKSLINRVRKGQDTTLAAAFAYNTIFAIPALIILTVTVAVAIDRLTGINLDGRLRTTIQDRAPADTKALLTTLVDDAIAKVSGGAAAFGLVSSALLALWSGSNAISALINAFNMAYRVEDRRPFLKRKGMTLGLTLLFAVLINVAFVLLVFGRRIGEWIASAAHLGSAFDLTWGILRWPVAIIVIAELLGLLYYLGPDVDQTWHWVSAGSVLATLLWLVATGLFGLYLSVSNPGNAYGALGSVLVLLFYLYLTGLIVLVGAELNALLAERFDGKTMQDVASHPAQSSL